jgi:BirA family biotin operon repressor/biotin-[acetyl-CoA-carboxylase] ligase
MFFCKISSFAVPSLTFRMRPIEGCRYLTELREFEVVDSTNDVLRRWMKEESMDTGIVVQAMHQTSGRGQFGTSWQNQEGKDLLMSIFFKPGRAFTKGPWTLNMSICLALRKFCNDILGREVQVKWPNDLIVNDRKIAGILIENHISHKWESSVIGLGLNVNQENLPDGFQAASLAGILGHSLELDRLRDGSFFELDAYLHRFTQEEPIDLLAEYNGHLYRKDQWARFKKAERIFRGMILGVKEDGTLLLRDEEGRVIQPKTKEIEYIWQ